MRARKVNEAKIQPDRELFDFFKNVMIGVRESGTKDAFNDLNDSLNDDHVVFVDFKDHLKNVPASERQMLARVAMISELGIRLMGYDPPTKDIFIAVDETFDDKFMRMPVDRLESIVDRLWAGFGHETIHQGQVSKMGVEQNPEFASEDDYFKNKQEIMAMAFSFVEEMRGFHSDEEIMNLLKTGTAPPPPPPQGMPPGMRPPGMRFPGMPPPMHHPLYGRYKQLGGKAYKLFTKYVYQYLTQDDE